MRSCDIHNLQWENEILERGYKRAIPGTERLICPRCRHEHVYTDARDLNLNGAYIHKVPGLIGKRTGFQWGALASQLKSLNWTIIAEKQLKAGKSGNIKDQSDLDNSVRGLPFHSRRENEDIKEALLKHCTEPPAVEKVEAVFLTADTQDDGWRWELRALTTDSNRYQLDYGDAKYIDLTENQRAGIIAKGEAESKLTGEKFTPPRTLGDVMRSGWNGLPVVMAMIDEGGHRKDDVSAFVKANPRAFSYKGGWQGGFDAGKAWAWSAKQEKLILARRPDYQDALLFYLHFQKNTENNYWFLLPREQLTDQYIDEILSVQENPKLKESHLRRNWDHQGRKHDYFDVAMMYLVLEDVAISSLDLSEFQHGIAEILHRDDDNDDDAADVKPAGKPAPGFVDRWR